MARSGVEAAAGTGRGLVWPSLGRGGASTSTGSGAAGAAVVGKMLSRESLGCFGVVGVSPAAWEGRVGVRGPTLLTSGATGGAGARLRTSRARQRGPRLARTCTPHCWVPARRVVQLGPGAQDEGTQGGGCSGQSWRVTPAGDGRGLRAGVTRALRGAAPGLKAAAPKPFGPQGAGPSGLPPAGTVSCSSEAPTRGLWLQLCTGSCQVGQGPHAVPRDRAPAPGPPSSLNHWLDPGPRLREPHASWGHPAPHPDPVSPDICSPGDAPPLAPWVWTTLPLQWTFSRREGEAGPVSRGQKVRVGSLSSCRWGVAARPALGTERPHRPHKYLPQDPATSLQPAPPSGVSWPCPSPAPTASSRGLPRQRKEAGWTLGPARGLRSAHYSATSAEEPPLQTRFTGRRPCSGLGESCGGDGALTPPALSAGVRVPPGLVVGRSLRA